MGFAEILGALTTGAAGGILGGLTGLAGTGITAFINYKSTKLKYEQEKALRELDMKEIELEAQTAIQVETARAAIREEEMETQGYLESMKDANKLSFDSSYMSYMHPALAGFVAMLFALKDFTCGTIRPVLTYYFVWKSAEIIEDVLQRNPAALAGAATAEQVVFIFMYLMSTCVTWWFGDRRMSKHIAKMYGGEK